MQYIYFLTWLGISVTLFISTFLFFVAIMKMREMQDTINQLHWSVRWVCYLLLAIGLVLDTALNWILLTVAFYEIPQEFLSTSRVIRHKFHSGGFRNQIALWFCKNWLTPFDSRHCEE
jgi:hypothetical protein